MERKIGSEVIDIRLSGWLNGLNKDLPCRMIFNGVKDLRMVGFYEKFGSLEYWSIGTSIEDF